VVDVEDRVVFPKKVDAKEILRWLTGI